MLRTRKDLFDVLTEPAADQSPVARAHAVQLATAELLVDDKRADPRIDAAEHRAVSCGRTAAATGLPRVAASVHHDQLALDAT